MRLPLTAHTRVLVLTGAGVSAESSVPTFRDAGGLWEQHRIEDVASPEGFHRDPRLVWRFYSQRRTAASACAPNAGHHALASLEARLGERFLLASQNMDGLHARAGSRRLLELHGNLFFTRCTACARPPFADDATYLAEPPRCDHCERSGRRALLRPHIVWFGEMLSPGHLAAVDEFLRAPAPGGLVFLAVGTSGSVYPAAGLVDLARQRGADTWLVNAEPSENASSFQHFVQGRSAAHLPALLG